MNKLKKKLIECLALKSLKDDFAKSQRWEKAAENREKERQCARDFYNLFNGTSIDDFDWMTYDLCIKDYCISEYGTDDTKCILRVEKLKQLGI
jgi:hypothetical protein